MTPVSVVSQRGWSFNSFDFSFTVFYEAVDSRQLCGSITECDSEDTWARNEDTDLCCMYYSQLWGCAGDRVEVVTKVYFRTVLGGEFPAILKMRPPKQSLNALWQPSRPGLPRNLKVGNIRKHLSNSFVIHEEKTKEIFVVKKTVDSGCKLP